MTSEDTLQHSDQAGTGQQLRQAREASGLTVAQVAENQHLRPSIIQAIENGEYRQIDSELFLKGYVRTYAGLVGLDPDVVIASLDSELEPLRREREEAFEANPLQHIERRKRYKKRIARLVFMLVAAVVIAYGAVRFIATNTELLEDTVNEDSVGEMTTTPDEKGESSTEELTVSSVDEAQSASTVATTEPLYMDETEAPTNDVVDDSAPATVEPPSVASDAAGDADEEIAPEEPVIAAGSSVEAVSSQSTSNAEGQNGSPRQARLTASFSGDCWVQVTDARGQSLVSSLRRAGDSINIEGVAPLRIVFGAADAVERVEFSGEAVDMSPYNVVNNRVEFSLGTQDF